MSTAAAPSTRPSLHRLGARRIRVTLLGAPTALDAHVPRSTSSVTVTRVDCQPGDVGAIESARPVAADAVVAVDPASMTSEQLRAIAQLPAPTLGMLVAGIPQEGPLQRSASFDRIVSFDPRLTGAPVGDQPVWRSVPPPVADDVFADVRPSRRPMRAMSLGRSTPHREAMLMPSKHEHDLLHVVHGLSGEALRETLDAHDVGVYVTPEDTPAFDWQAAAHLAAGQLLIAEPVSPAHGLERDIDFLSITSPEDLAWTLQGLRGSPDAYRRIRIRGRMKAEHFRASRVFERLLRDLAADVAAFGPQADRHDAAAASPALA